VHLHLDVVYVAGDLLQRRLLHGELPRLPLEQQHLQRVWRVLHAELQLLLPRLPDHGVQLSPRPLALALVVALCWPLVARADTEDAKAHYKKGLSFYALDRFTEAAAEYEKAFELEPDPALLYNAAQAHRLGGNKQRALTLYQNYLRLFPNPANKADVQRHIAALKTALESEGKARTSPPTDPMTPAQRQAEPTPVPVATPKPEPMPAQPTPQVDASQPSLTTTAPPPARKKTPKWVWGVVGGVGAAVVLGVGLGLGLGLSGTEYPTAGIGTARVQ
jgi:tetratricopeptide (TPR) repeat protein